MRNTDSTSESEQETTATHQQVGAQEKSGNHARETPLQQLHRTVGNQVVQQLHEEGVVQPQLAQNNPSDTHEREADRVAEEVIQAKQSAHSEDRRTRHASDPVVDADALQTKPVSGSTPLSSDLREQVRSLTTGGQPLDKETRSYFESGFGRSFEDVRVHTGQDANEMAGSLNARAFTVGRDIAFARGEFDPATREGKKLVAHELTHVVQQNGVKSRAVPSIQRQSEGDGESDQVHFPRQRRVELSVDPKPTGQFQAQHPEKWEEIGRPIPDEITKEFLVDQKLREEDHAMRWALLFAASELAGKRLEEKLLSSIPYGPLNTVLSKIKGLIGWSPTSEEMHERFIDLTIDSYLEETGKELEHMKQYYQLRRRIRQSKVPEGPTGSTPDPEQTLYFEFDSTEFNEELTSAADWQYTVLQVRSYIRNCYEVNARKPSIHVEGYASMVGEKDHNQELAFRRANTVMKKLRSELQDMTIDYKIWASSAGESALLVF